MRKNIIVEEMTDKDHQEFDDRQDWPETQNVLDKARMFATVAHGGQMRKDGKTPYIAHPERVVKILQKSGIEDEEILASAYLHDVLEDTNSKLDGFSSRVQKIVSELTNNSKDKNSYMKSFGEKSPEAILIKLADRFDNLRDGSKTMGEEWLKKYLVSTKILLDMASKSKWPPIVKMLKNLRNLYDEVSSVKRI